MLPLTPTRLMRRVRDRLVADWYDRLVADLDHDLRGPLTVIRGEVELVLSQCDVAREERQRSAKSVIEQVVEIERLLDARCGDES